MESVGVTWESADDAIATVDSTGRVTSVGYGITEISATTGPLTAIVVVYVTLPLSDQEILEILYGETGGENWTNTTNWLSNEPLDEWFGVEADDSGNVTQLSLAENNLVGSIPLELAGLEGLLDNAVGIGAVTNVVGLVFGGFGLALELGAEPEWEPLLYARSRVVHAAAVSGLPAYDMPSRRGGSEYAPRSCRVDRPVSCRRFWIGTRTVFVRGTRCRWGGTGSTSNNPFALRVSGSMAMSVPAPSCRTCGPSPADVGRWGAAVAWAVADRGVGRAAVACGRGRGEGGEEWASGVRDCGADGAAGWARMR